MWLDRYVIAGCSMVPALRPRDTVLALRVPKQWLRVGQIVVAQPPHAPFIIKRIAALHQSGMVSLASDNPAAVSEYTDAPLSNDVIRGIVVWVAGRGIVPLRPHR